MTGLLSRGLLLRTCSICLLLTSQSQATELCNEAKLAWADAQRLTNEEAIYTRYLTIYNLTDEEVRILHEKVALLYQLNNLSQLSDFGRPVKVGPTLYKINMLWFGENFIAAYENFAKTNPYFPCFEKIQVAAVARAKIYVFRNGFHEISSNEVKQGEKVYKKSGERAYQEITIEPEIVPVKVVTYLPAIEMQGLAIKLKTRVPIIRADWFFYRTAISLGRQGDGYLDFHNIKSKEDALKLAVVDLKVVEKFRLDMAAMIAESDVAVNRNRQVWNVKSYLGRWWQTFDIGEDPTGKRNLIRLLGTALDKVDFDHDAEETFFTLPNRLFGFLANDNKGVIQRSVPDSIASDDTTTDKDKRIHVGPVSCIRCHEEGLRPINDWGRKAYAQAEDATKTGQNLLGTPDPKKLIRLKQLYLGDLPRQLEEDNFNYARALKELNGMTPKELSAGVSKVWQRYKRPLGMEQLAEELGVKAEVWDKALRNHVANAYAKKQIVDPLLVGLIGKNPQKLLRPHAEELFPVMQVILKEWTP